MAVPVAVPETTKNRLRPPLVPHRGSLVHLFALDGDFVDRSEDEPPPDELEAGEEDVGDAEGVDDKRGDGGSLQLRERICRCARKR